MSGTWVDKNRRHELDKRALQRQTAHLAIPPEAPSQENLTPIHTRTDVQVLSELSVLGRACIAVAPAGA